MKAITYDWLVALHFMLSTTLGTKIFIIAPEVYVNPVGAWFFPR